MEEVEALIILNSLSRIGSNKICYLIEHYGSANAVLNAPLEEIATFPGFGLKTLQNWHKSLNKQDWKKNLILAERLETQLITYQDPLYPRRLLEIADYPLVLYMKGTLKPEDQNCLAVVGTRQSTIYGQEMAKQISQELAAAGFTIVSGLARGIDTAAHQGALKSGRTMAFLGSGIACLYPSENKSLAEEISQKGALMSEFSMATPPEKYHFPQRNRLVSGMTMGTIVIEAPPQSGAILTANQALNQGRPLFALPGRVDQESFKGNHTLIKEGKAKLIENVQDILKNYLDSPVAFKLQSENNVSVHLEKEEKELFDQMPTQEISIEELVNYQLWPIAKLNALLMSLVLKKVVKEYPGKIYKKK